jgi:hypothetical protein
MELRGCQGQSSKDGLRGKERRSTKKGEREEKKEKNGELG